MEQRENFKVTKSSDSDSSREVTTRHRGEFLVPRGERLRHFVDEEQTPNDCFPCYMYLQNTLRKLLNEDGDEAAPQARPIFADARFREARPAQLSERC